MNFTQAAKIVNSISMQEKGRKQTEAEIIALKAAWDKIDYALAIKNSKANYSENYIRSDAGRKLWLMLSGHFGEKITKMSLRRYFERHPELLDPDKRNQKILGGYPPDIENFVGRQSEAEELKQWSKTIQCVCIDGIAGIGKTCLAAKAINAIFHQPSQFEHYIWLPVHYKPSLNELLDSLIEHLGATKGEETQLSRSSILIQYLQRHRCLIVLDEVDLMLQTNQETSECEVFFRRIIEEKHQSCVWLTANCFPEGLSNYKNMGFPFESLHLGPLQANDVQKLVESHGITFDADWEKMVHTCMGNPLLLHSVLRKVSKVLGGQADLVNQKTSLALNEFEYLLNKLFTNTNDIKELEIIVLCTIASIDRTQSGISLLALTQNILENHPDISELDIFNSLERLQNHNLLSLVTDTGSIEIVMVDIIKKYILRNYINNDQNTSSILT